jgi:uncharacterized membrane protein YphA (DoxX/SURF4 family)
MHALESRLAAIARPVSGAPVLYFTALLGLCAAYLQGGLNKLTDFPSAIGEMTHFPGTAGKGSAWSGAYGQIRLDYAFTPNLSGAIEAVHYDIGDTIRRAGGHDGNYLGVQMAFAW